MRELLPLLAVVLVAAGCGTGVYHHRIEVTVNDPSKRLAAPTVVSVFDHQSGVSEDWARRTIGTSTPGAPYAGETSATDVKMVYDMSPPADVKAGVYVPALEKDGYFILDIKPAEGPEQATTLGYYSFYVPTGADEKILPLAARFTSESARKGWTIHLTVDVPPGDNKP